MPNGKPTGVRCAHLTAAFACELFDDPRRPAVCARLRPSREMCGESREQALLYLRELEALTRADQS